MYCGVAREMMREKKCCTLQYRRHQEAETQRDRQTDRQRQTENETDGIAHYNTDATKKPKLRERERDRQTDRQRMKQAQTDRQRQRDTEILGSVAFLQSTLAKLYRQVCMEIINNIIQTPTLTLQNQLRYK